MAILFSGRSKDPQRTLVDEQVATVHVEADTLATKRVLERLVEDDEKYENDRPCF